MSTELDNELKPLSTMWWLLVLLGLISAGVGIFFVASPHESLATFTVIAGLLLLFDGAMAILASIFGKGEGRGLLATVGVLGLIAGVVLIKHPFNALVIFVMVLGIWFIASGIVRLIAAFADPEARGANLALALVDAIAGIVILAWPDLTLSTLAVIVGILLILRGVASVYVGIALHGAIKDLKSTDSSA
jgi:uncharacterized membrane protein HdeD (DUF308 family)